MGLHGGVRAGGRNGVREIIFGHGSQRQLPLLVAGLAFALAFVFGAVANRVNFCTMGAVIDIVTFGDWRRMRMWVLAIAVAIAGTGALVAAGLDRPGEDDLHGAAGALAVVHRRRLPVRLRHDAVVRLRQQDADPGRRRQPEIAGRHAGAGHLGVHDAEGAVRGLARRRARPVALRRRGLGAATSDLPTLAAALGAPVAAKLWLPFVLAAALAVFVFKDRDFRATPELIVGGIVIGLVIVGGWYVSGHLGYLAEDPATLEEKFVATNSGRMESFSFVAPVAYTLELLMLWSDQSRIVTFGIAGVLGMLAGSAAYALASRTFRWEGFGSVEDVANHMVGAVLMGFGGVTALGCTIGQGMSGISTLAVGSFLTLAAIIAGCVAAVRYQMWRLERMA